MGPKGRAAVRLDVYEAGAVVRHAVLSVPERMQCASGPQLLRAGSKFEVQFLTPKHQQRSIRTHGQCPP